MRITDELRNWMENAFTYKSVDGDMFHKVNTPWFGWKQDIEEMLDRIDATYEEDVNTACKLANALSADELNERGWIFATDENMAEHGWVKLPVDADDVPIHVGDVMESRGGTVFEVEEISLYSYGWRCDGHGRDKNGFECNAHISPIDLTHHRTPTVEDVLREFTDAILEWAGKSGTVAEVGYWSEVAAEYIAKLQLREG